MKQRVNKRNLNIMRNLLLLKIIIFCFIGCKTDKTKELDYCQILERDQSHVDHTETDTSIIAENRRIRRQYFSENFNQIIEHIKQNGFPRISRETMDQDSCKFHAIQITLIHTIQTRPEVFFSDEIISLFEKEIKNGNMQPEDLLSSFRVGFQMNNFCKDLKENIERAIHVWKITQLKNVELNYTDCPS